MVKSASGFKGVFYTLCRLLSGVFGGGQGMKVDPQAKPEKQDTFVYSMY